MALIAALTLAACASARPVPPGTPAGAEVPEALMELAPVLRAAGLLP